MLHRVGLANCFYSAREIKNRRQRMRSSKVLQHWIVGEGNSKPVALKQCAIYDDLGNTTAETQIGFASDSTNCPELCQD